MSLDIAARLAEVTGAPVNEQHGVVTAQVSRERWMATVTAVRDDDELDGRYFDLLTVVDQHPAGLDVVVRVWSVQRRHAMHLTASLSREEPRVDSLTGVFAGAGWHERQAAEMFGVSFDGHPDLTPLLLPVGGVATPLRKEHLLERRGDRPWPGSQDPAHSGEGGRPARRVLQPPGVA